LLVFKSLIACTPARIDLHVAAELPPQLLQCLHERLKPGLTLRGSSAARPAQCDNAPGLIAAPL
jgi:hypothetical protein